MSNTTLKNLLTEYENKRMRAIKLAEQRKKELYIQNPKLQEIDDKLNPLSISTAKCLINKNYSELLKNLEKNINILKKEKILILNSIGKDESYILPNYACKLCNDTGYVMQNSHSIMCSCLKQKIFDLEYNKSNIYNIKNQNFNNFNDLFYSNVVDEKKYKSDISPRENIKLIKDICFKFINNFENPEEKNLLFTGNTGLGKTFISSCIANELIKKNKTVLYQTAPVMLDTIIDYRFGKNTNSNILENILTVDLLIIDDLGTECVNNMKFTELFNIINTRLLNQKNITKTIISTNLSLQNLYNTYDERIVSRIVGNYNICYFFGDDIRFKKICE